MRRLDRVLSFTLVGQTIYFRHFGVLLKKSGTKVIPRSCFGLPCSRVCMRDWRLQLPRVELEEVGPRMDLLFRRRKQAAEAVVKQSCVLLQRLADC